MLKNVNRLQNCEACLHLLASKYPLTQVGMHYKSNQVAHILFRMTVASHCAEHFQMMSIKVIIQLRFAHVQLFKLVHRFIVFLLSVGTATLSRRSGRGVPASRAPSSPSSTTHTPAGPSSPLPASSPSPP